MRLIFLATIASLTVCQPKFYAQTPSAPKLYAHKVVVDSIIQTKAYTYLKVTERIKEKDSLQWLALPLITPKVGDTYYFNKGLQMGEFTSKELNRKFGNILFLGTLGTSAEMSEKNIIPVPVLDTAAMNEPPLVVHTVVVKEVIQTSGYTYLRVLDGDKEDWLAMVKRNANVGQIYTYDDAAPMKDFVSKELKRTFSEVLFVAKLTLVTAVDDISRATDKNKKEKSSKKAKLITIANLLEKKKNYSGKAVQIKGKVTKYNTNILDKIWIHVEDGTAFAGKFDLTITTNQEVKVGDNITAEGKITLDKDFGSGYFFEVIMEDATIQSIK